MVVDGVSKTRREWKLDTRADLRLGSTSGVCWRAIKHVADKLEASENASTEGFPGWPVRVMLSHTSVLVIGTCAPKR